SNIPTSKRHNLLIRTRNRVNLAALERSFQDNSNHICKYT
ncbi:hypothetical protein MTR67_019309, partial [Solanum verrucosum]